MVGKRFNKMLFDKKGKILAIGGIVLIVFAGLYLVLPALFSVSAEDLVASPDVVAVSPDTASIGDIGGGAIASASPSPSPSPSQNLGFRDRDNGIDPASPSYVSGYWDGTCGEPSGDSYRDFCYNQFLLQEYYTWSTVTSRVCGQNECCDIIYIESINCNQWCIDNTDWNGGLCKNYEGSPGGGQFGYCRCENLS